ncbi:MAG: hypothetical protein ABSD72_15850 [Terracidiphilus sp.]|jgi:hypothetical protein
MRRKIELPELSSINAFAHDVKAGGEIPRAIPHLSSEIAHGNGAMELSTQYLRKVSFH